MGRTCVGRQIGMLGAPVGAIGGVIPWWDPNEEGLCIWSAYQPVGAASFAASILDLSGNGNNAVDPGGAATPGWDAANGWVLDGIGNYLTTTFVPQNDQTQSVLVQFTNATNNDTSLFGMRNGGATQQFMIFPRSTAGTQVMYANGNISLVGPMLAAGNLGVAGNQGYRNGAADGGAIAVWGGAAVLTCFIGARNRGFADLFCAANIQALAIYDCVLTAPQMLATATAMAAL